MKFYNLVNFLVNNPCEDPEILKVILFIRKIMGFAFFAIPLVLIVLITFDFIKSMSASSEDVMKKNQKIVIKRLIYAVLLFFVVPIVNLAFSAFGTSGNDRLLNQFEEDKVNYLSCWDNAKSLDVIDSFERTAVFKGNGGVVYGDSKKTCGASDVCEIKDFPRATKSGSTFIGWSSTPDCDENSNIQGAVFLYEKEKTYYACYEEKVEDEPIVTPGTPSTGESGASSSEGSSGGSSSGGSSGGSSSGGSTVVTPTPYTNFEGFLFIGDSQTAALKGNSELSGAIITAEVGYMASDWLDRMSTIQNAINGKTIKAVSILLGANYPDYNGLVSLIEKVQELNGIKGKNIPIYVQPVFPIAEGGIVYADIGWKEFLDEVNPYNEKVKTYCSGKSNIYFVDTRSGLYNTNGSLKAEYVSGDKCHMNSSGNSIWINNMKKLMLNGENSGSSGGSSSGSSSSGSSNASGWWWPIEEADKNLAYMIQGNSPSHFGIDITSYSGEKGVIDVIAAYDGEVIVAENDVPPQYDDLYGQAGATSSAVHDGYGNYVVIKHNYNGETYYSYYAHMTQDIKVEVGQIVTTGTLIGKMGSSGNSSGTHLHFEIRDSDRIWEYEEKTDPLNFVKVGEYPKK